MQRSLLFLSVLPIAMATFVVEKAHAVMGGPTIMERVDTDGDRKLSLAEVRAAAARRYNLIKNKNGNRVTMLQLGGRIVPSDTKAVGGSAGVAEAVSKEQYLALVDNFFDEADAKRKDGDKRGDGKLDLSELETPAGKKLIGLLQ